MTYREHRRFAADTIRDASAALNNATEVMIISRREMRRSRAVMRLQSRVIRRERRWRNLACGLSIAQSITLAAMLLFGCNVYDPVDPAPVEITPTCEFAIDYVHHTTETIGDCDAGVEPK